MGRVVANLFEAHHEGQHQPTPLDGAFGRFLEALGQFFNGALVEGGLRFCQRAPGGEFGLLGQVRQDAAIGLEPAQ